MILLIFGASDYVRAQKRQNACLYTHADGHRQKAWIIFNDYYMLGILSVLYICSCSFLLNVHQTNKYILLTLVCNGGY